MYLLLESMKTFKPYFQTFLKKLIMKKFLFSLVAILTFTICSFSQGVVIKNATPVDMTLTDFVFIDPSCSVPLPNFYGINEFLPNMSYTYSVATHTGSGWKLAIQDVFGNWASLRDETPAGCGTGFVNFTTIGAYSLTWWYDPSTGDVFIYIF